MKGLTKGRNVHYVTETGDINAAIVAKVLNRDTGEVNLATFNENGSNIGRLSVPYAEYDPAEHEKMVPQTWHWIPRED